MLREFAFAELGKACFPAVRWESDVKYCEPRNGSGSYWFGTGAGSKSPNRGSFATEIPPVPPDGQRLRLIRRAGGVSPRLSRRSGDGQLLENRSEWAFDASSIGRRRGEGIIFRSSRRRGSRGRLGSGIGREISERIARRSLRGFRLWRQWLGLRGKLLVVVFEIRRRFAPIRPDRLERAEPSRQWIRSRSAFGGKAFASAGSAGGSKLCCGGAWANSFSAAAGRG